MPLCYLAGPQSRPKIVRAVAPARRSGFPAGRHACVALRAKEVRVRAMFEARFQSFEDSSERAESASRVSALLVVYRSVADEIEPPGRDTFQQLAPLLLQEGAR